MREEHNFDEILVSLGANPNILIDHEIFQWLKRLRVEGPNLPTLNYHSREVELSLSINNHVACQLEIGIQLKGFQAQRQRVLKLDISSVFNDDRVLSVLGMHLVSFLLAGRCLQTLRNFYRAQLSRGADSPQCQWTLPVDDWILLPPVLWALLDTDAMFSQLGKPTAKMTRLQFSELNRIFEISGLSNPVNRRKLSHAIEVSQSTYLR